MKLEEVLSGIDYELLKGKDDIEVRELAYNSRTVKKNDVFFCISGFKTDGHKYAENAVENGAEVIVCEKDIKLKQDVTVIKVKDTRKTMALAAANFYDNPCSKMKFIGITGTNGKTTSTYMIKSILEQAGFKVGLIGTICNYIGTKKLHTDRTTPESLELQKLFYEMVNEGIEYCVMEVSSHSLALDRVYGIKFKYGIFTNLTQDHLDFHKTFENYYEAKLKLFKNSDISIINLDDIYGERICKDATNIKVTYSIEKEADICAGDIEVGPRSIKYDLKFENKKQQVEIYIPGRYNVYNSLCAAAVCLKEGIELETVKEGLEKTQVPGRCELVTKDYDLGYDVIIDYAHTPDGLEKILKSLREIKRGRLISVFGCGGNRDKAKRPIMGKIGCDLSDFAIITSDNPRDEEPMDIINDIVSGVDKNNYTIVENRKEAIKEAISIAKKDDIILIAGKGHEDYQIFKDNKVIHFDEKEIVYSLIQ
ncbi:UDP-N-acetylmuramoyl-L-alanyl-D-glutamate--2,6-diaminopimelate ligase [Clostridium oryzae]|uniref:UDP-N-acetylmuramoyl-L-alanyl-D-glutamate--2, 6-diaminopimelate ligase n=1 Tax=Clostridium oryzae TaxID=1450648 RepID=UPI0009A4D04B|nr:UDP-N-acetylmuramoyl-L-alanyl-D-glutamate--2,6-diaminopimelate ligase [Clostridium oryzae]